MGFFLSPQAKHAVPPVTFQTFAELYVSSGRFVFQAEPQMFDAYMMCRVPRGSIVVDCIMGFDAIWSAGGEYYWDCSLWSRSTTAGEFNPILDATIDQDIVIPQNTVYRGRMPKALTAGIKDRMSRAFHYDTWIGLMCPGPGTTFIPGAVIGVDLFFRMAEPNEY